MTHDPLYDIARSVTDEVLGDGAYARLNAHSPDPQVQAAIANAPTPAPRHPMSETDHEGVSTEVADPLPDPLPDADREALASFIADVLAQHTPRTDPHTLDTTCSCDAYPAAYAGHHLHQARAVVDALTPHLSPRSDCT